MSVVDSLKKSVANDEKRRLALKCALAKEILAVRGKFKEKDRVLRREVRDLNRAINILQKKEVVGCVKDGKI
jgi:VIT1/CCC1 family predicted Fe2+/Mn2+ transporter